MKQSVFHRCAKRTALCAGLVVLLCVFAPAGFSAGEAAPPKIPLKEAALKDFSSVPSPMKLDVVPNFKETVFPLDKAANLKEVEEVVGKLTAEQKSALQKNRFLLLQKPSLHTFSSMGRYDEMLCNFEGIGGSYDPAYREP